ncbi:hypothetical protein [Mesorhizobium sp. M4A.F.Ca.ET.020.02.1.1]|uniref:hypothetical protein n=1 Tax=Mesorhizobium sp. TaxID=1871066 RepID=UPI0016732179
MAICDWQDSPPGFIETGVLVRGPKLLSEKLTELRRLLPLQLLGFETDNDSMFLNEAIRDQYLDIWMPVSSSPAPDLTTRAIRRSSNSRTAPWSGALSGIVGWSGLNPLRLPLRNSIRRCGCS